MRKRYFVLPYSAEGIDTVDDLTAAVNASLEGAEPENNADNGTVEPPVDNAEPETPAGEPKPEPQQRTQEAKQNYAFAQQQHEISELTELLQTMADATGIKYTDKKDLVTKLKDKALVDRATQQNVPVELLREVEQLRQDSAQWKRYQNEQAAMAGFNAIQNEFGLDQAALESFAVELDRAGKNPFNGGVDVAAEYKARHINEIIEQRVNAAVQAALTRNNTVNANSSTPSAMQGAASSDNAPQRIDSVAALNALLMGR